MDKKRKCDCWIGKDSDGVPTDMTCYCPEDIKSTRYSVRKNGEVHSRWETINDALEDGRKNVGAPFEIYDELEQETRINYE